MYVLLEILSPVKLSLEHACIQFLHLSGVRANFMKGMKCISHMCARCACLESLVHVP